MVATVLLTLLCPMSMPSLSSSPDAGCVPAGILPTHLANQISDFARNDASWFFATHLPGPEQTKGGTMLGYDRFWLDDGQRRAPIAPEARQTDPQQAVARGQL
jgi:hypothetical protein